MNLKMKLAASLKTWVVIYPSLLVLQYLFADTFSVLSLYQRTFLLTLALVPWVIFIGLPFVNFLIRKITGNEKL